MRILTRRVIVFGFSLFIFLFCFYLYRSWSVEKLEKAYMELNEGEYSEAKKNFTPLAYLGNDYARSSLVLINGLGLGQAVDIEEVVKWNKMRFGGDGEKFIRGLYYMGRDGAGAGFGGDKVEIGNCWVLIAKESGLKMNLK